MNVPKALRNAQTQPEQIQIKTWQDEIFVMTGPVQLIQPLSDFMSLETCGFLSDQAYRRVIELGDFPKELKTSDLESVLHSGLVKIKDYYDLRWVDDNHALVIFSDEITASRSLRIRDPQIKFRPFYESCTASKNKAKSFDLETKTTERTRPNTSTVMARRLLSRALNNPNIKSSPEDENALKEARLKSKK